MKTRPTRRDVVNSLTRTALVLPFADVLQLAGQPIPQRGAAGGRAAYSAPSRPAPKGVASPVAGTPLGYSYVDVARESGLNVKTIYGGEHKNRLRQRRGCCKRRG